MKVLFIEPPKDIWFVMGEYLPPPFGIIQLGAYLEREVDGVEIEVLDCNAQGIDWDELERRIEIFDPDVAACSALATCNTYEVARTLETVKRVDSDILTLTGGQHFTATAHESLSAYPEIDVIVRGEGEVTLKELVEGYDERQPLHEIDGISYRDGDRINHNVDRPLIEDINTLPYPGYHLVSDLMERYHFRAMTGPGVPYALIEGSRGCPHKCTFCSQWPHWQGRWRQKTPERIADELEYCYEKFGSRFIWLTDDNFGGGDRGGRLAEEILKRDIGDDISWFLQLRCDDVISIRETLPRLREAGLQWVMMGVESSRESTLETYKKGIAPDDAFEAVRLLKENDIFSHTMFIIGDRKDTAESIEYTRKYVTKLDPDFAIFSALTPFPGTEVYDEAKRNGWIEETNLSNYDMAHAVMPTETLTRLQVQEELYRCYRRFYGSWPRRIKGIFSSNALKRRINMYMAGRGIIHQFKTLFEGPSG
ncbi:MAG TPA: radical SAM protein [Patescibacteria group bacterium]|nr:radical SAM protein [Patescibacteria group bacterium]